MHLEDNDGESVYQLITELCKCIARQNGLHSVRLPAAVRKLKSQAYGILLHKTGLLRDAAAGCEDAEFDAQHAMAKHLFAAKLHQNRRSALGECNSEQDSRGCTQLNELESQLEELFKEVYYREGSGCRVLQLLLALQGHISAAEDNETYAQIAPELLVPGPFTLHANYQLNRHYPVVSLGNDVWHQKPRYFKGLSSLKSSENPYMPKYSYDGEPNCLHQIEVKYSPAKTTGVEPCSFTGLASRLLGDSLRINVRPFRLFVDCGLLPGDSTRKDKTPQTAPNTKKITTKPKIITKERETTNEENRIFSWSWQSLGSCGVVRAKPFASESQVTLDLQAEHSRMLGRAYGAKIVSQQQFLQDLKSLTVGIQSDIFQHDEQQVFSMQTDVTVPDMLPATIKAYVVEFLEGATCYKRLQVVIMKRDYKLTFEGFVHKALCSAIAEYLNTFRQFVFGEEDKQLIDFYRRMQKPLRLLTNLSHTLAIHPTAISHVAAPSLVGSQFLGYLYREVMSLTEKEYITLLMFILKRCCHVYFKHLQKWIFHGLLDDPCNELFIGYLDHYRPHTKYFYDKAYFVRKDAVPGFFQGYEDQILQCGKYTMLLKAYKPQHALFDLQCPAMTVCLSFEEIEKMELQCQKYYETASEHCGNPISIAQIFESRIEQRRNFLNMVSQRSKENMAKWTEKQLAIAVEIAERKQQRLEELSTQLQDVKQRKIDDRRANVEQELLLLRKTAKLEELRLARQNINLRKRIEYYQELSDTMQEEATESARTARSTVSTVGTDDEPYDDDAISEYIDCSEDGLLEKSADSETELGKGSPSGNDTQLAVQTEDVELNYGDKLEPPAIMLKRSVSDVLNSNELAVPLPAQTAQQESHDRALGGAQMALCMQHSTGPNLIVETETPLTEAQRNKLRVLGDDFGYVSLESRNALMPDVNLNTLPDDELSDLQRNRKRMMHNDPFVQFNKDPLAERAQLYLELDTERARNRRKVLESEFDIITGDTKGATLEAVSLLTPMSTTSDPPLSMSTSDLERTCQSNDTENGNVSEPKKLTLDVQLAQQEQNKQAATSTALVHETPESALNTAGLTAKHGFQFGQCKELARAQQLEAISEVPIQNDSILVDECGGTLINQTPNYAEPYGRCVQLIESNFQCQTRSPFVRLNKSPTVSSSAASLAARESRARLQQFNVNSMSVITLTEFLQKSVLKPMSVHLALLNNEVMRLFLEELRIIDHLRSLRHYFFLMDGEFGAKVCDGILEQLDAGAAPQQLLNYQMLHCILDTALGSSVMGPVKNAENLSFIVKEVPQQFDHSSPSMLATLSLSYSISWPLNLILSPEVIEQYGEIFCHLLKVRRISWLLERAYQMLNEAVKRRGTTLLRSPQYRHVQQIRHKFYHFVHALQHHITANALQASWKTFKDDLLHAKSIEDIFHKHGTYVRRIRFLCLLDSSSGELFSTTENIFTVTLKFYNHLKECEFHLADESGGEYKHAHYDALAAHELEFEHYIKFAIEQGQRLVRRGNRAELDEFISLINYNQYYTDPKAKESSQPAGQQIDKKY